MSDRYSSELDEMWVEIHFKENSIPSVHAGPLTDKSKAKLSSLLRRVEVEAHRKGYQAGHQQGKTIAKPRRSRAYKSDNVIKEFTETLPADSKRCSCITCKVLNARIKELERVEGHHE